MGPQWFIIDKVFSLHDFQKNFSEKIALLSVQQNNELTFFFTNPSRFPDIRHSIYHSNKYTKMSQTVQVKRNIAYLSFDENTTEDTHTWKKQKKYLWISQNHQISVQVSEWVIKINGLFWTVDIRVHIHGPYKSVFKSSYKIITLQVPFLYICWTGAPIHWAVRHLTPKSCEVS